MQITTDLPVASLKEVRELSLDEAVYGSCTRRVRDGKTITLMGCPYAKDCEWATNQKYMAKKVGEGEEAKWVPDEGEPRPRNVKVRQSKPRSKGGFSIIENHCACFQWHGDVKKIDGHNDVMVEVVGGEGSKFTFRGTKPVQPTPGTVVNDPVFYKLEVPTFPSPMERQELMEAIEAGMIRKEAGDRARTQERSKRLGLSEEEELVASVTEESVRQAIGATGRKGA